MTSAQAQRMGLGESDIFYIEYPYEEIQRVAQSGGTPKVFYALGGQVGRLLVHEGLVYFVFGEQVLRLAPTYSN